MSTQTPLSGHKIATLLSTHDHATSLAICNKLHELGADMVAITPGADGLPAGLETGKAMNIQLADPSGFDSLLVIADESRVNKLAETPEMGAFAVSFFIQKKPVAAHGAGVQFLAELGVLEGRNVSGDSIALSDFPKHGAHIRSSDMTTDSGLTTAVSSVSTDEFAQKVAEEVKEGRHQGQHA
ncbi:MAG: DJ-1/PfpI family protein [Fimbriimonadaceae bacterium]|nr:MAG: DJ-1/PfpI family protein [Fimbriimonadaceae bacterium]